MIILLLNSMEFVVWFVLAHLGDDWGEIVEEEEEECLKFLTGHASVAVAAMLGVFVVLCRCDCPYSEEQKRELSEACLKFLTGHASVTAAAMLGVFVVLCRCDCPYSEELKRELSVGEIVGEDVRVCIYVYVRVTFSPSPSLSLSLSFS